MLYLIAEKKRSVESQIFLSNELIKFTDSFENISLGRKYGEILNMELESTKSKNESLLATIESQIDEITELIVERDVFEQETKIL